jgi:hypothetical protein
MRVGHWLSIVRSTLQRVRRSSRYNCGRSDLSREMRPEALESRVLLTIAGGVSGTDVVFSGDGAADSTDFAVTGGGLLPHNRGGVDGFNSSIDLDSTVVGDQTLLVSAITSMAFTDSGTNDAVTFDGGIPFAFNDPGFAALLIDTGAITSNLPISTAGGDLTLQGANSVALFASISTSGSLDAGNITLNAAGDVFLDSVISTGGTDAAGSDSGAISIAADGIAQLTNDVVGSSTNGDGAPIRLTAGLVDIGALVRTTGTGSIVVTATVTDVQIGPTILTTQNDLTLNSVLCRVILSSGTTLAVVGDINVGGDGSPDTVTTLPPGATAFSDLTHTYLDYRSGGGPFVIEVQLEDYDGGINTQIRTVDAHVVNVDPVIRQPALSSGGAAIAEGDFLTVSGAFTDVSPIDSHTVTVNWGDGTTTEAEVDSTARTYSATYQYGDEGNQPVDLYQIAVTVTDVDGGSDSVSVQQVVTNVAPTVSVAPRPGNTSPNLIALDAVAEDPGYEDQFLHAWHAYPLDNPAAVQSGTAAFFVLNRIQYPSSLWNISLMVDDQDGGVTPYETLLLAGSRYADSLTAASDSTVRGGDGNDSLQVKANTINSTFFGGADDDTLTVTGGGVTDLTFGGDDGADVLRNTGSIGTLTFNGSADDDVLVNQAGSTVTTLTFGGDDGADTLINNGSGGSDAFHYNATAFLARLTDTLNDTDIGAYHLILSRFARENASDDIDNIKGFGGIDVIVGGDGDDYSLAYDLGSSEAVVDGSTFSRTVQIR